MTPPARWPVALRQLTALVLTVAATAPVLVACASPGSPRAILRTPDPAWMEGSPWPTTPAPTGTHAPSPTATPTRDLAWYLSQLPVFDPAPAAQPVWLSRYEGHAALAYQIPTDQPVAFLTIDDGAVRHPMALELIRAARVPVTLFLTTNYVAGNRAWFAALAETGYVTIHNHTVSHPNLRTGGYGTARDQLCRANDNLAAWFGQRPTMFRPPYGEYDAATLQAAWDCGLTAGLHWRETVDQGKVNYQRDHGRIHAGDIILMHFRPAFPDDFLAALVAIKNSGLVPARLEDYVRVGAGMPLPTTAPPTTPPSTTGVPTTDPTETETTDPTETETTPADPPTGEALPAP